MAKYGAAAKKTVKSAMKRRKSGTLKSGSGRTVKSRKQAIAIGLNEARENGAKVPRRKRVAKKRLGRTPGGPAWRRATALAGRRHPASTTPRAGRTAGG